MDWENLRRQFSATRHQAYLNTGTLGPVPDPIMERYVAALVAWNQAGPGTPTEYIRWRDRAEETRALLVHHVGAHPDDLAFFDNVSDALNVALAGLRLAPGHRVITSDQEHGALVAPLALLQERGVVVDIVPYQAGGEDLLSRLAVELEKAPTALVALSHMSCETGAMVDAGRLAALCHRAGAVLLLDGAQTPGQVPLHLTRDEVDLYAFNGHKWMLAPVGSAALYVRPAVRDRVALTFSGDGPGWTTSYPARVDSRWTETGRRFEYGTRNWPAWVAWGDVLRFWADIPADAAYDRQRELAAILWRQLADVPGVTLWSPAMPPGGIVTLSVNGLPADALYEGLRARGVIGRAVRKGPIQGARLCTAFFNNLDDIGQAVDAVRHLARP